MGDPALTWAEGVLGPLELTRVRDRPWASVWRASSAQGLWWLKVSSAATGYERLLLPLLDRWSTDLVPHVVAHADEPWSLVADAGTVLREAVPAGPASVALWCTVLADYARLQRAVPAADALAVGVPDAGPAALPGLLRQLLDPPCWWGPDVAPELDDGDRRLIAGLDGPLTEAARQLDDGLPPAVQHDDLHGGNVVLADGRARIIDWGDACVAHPFGTLLVTERALAAEWSLAPGAPELRRVRDAYLEPWRTAGESRAELARQLALALATAGLARAASWARALGTPDAVGTTGIGNGVASWLLHTAAALPVTGAGRRT